MYICAALYNLIPALNLSEARISNTHTHTSDSTSTYCPVQISYVHVTHIRIIYMYRQHHMTYAYNKSVCTYTSVYVDESVCTRTCTLKDTVVNYSPSLFVQQRPAWSDAEDNAEVAGDPGSQVLQGVDLFTREVCLDGRSQSLRQDHVRWMNIISSETTTRY